MAKDIKYKIFSSFNNESVYNKYQQNKQQMLPEKIECWSGRKFYRQWARKY